jgi:N-acetylneuraminate epimerase
MKILLILLALLSGCKAPEAGWKQLPSLPDKQGFAGSFAGVSGCALLFAGGANFPHAKPWEGGKKVWYDSIFVLENPQAQWKVAGKLPRPLGYGVNVTHNGAVICVGGSDANRHHAQVLRLNWRAGQLLFDQLPPLPIPLANACGALVGDTLYIAGGLKKPDATQALKTVYRINLAASNPTWQEIEPIPGTGRMLSIAGSFDGAFWLIGGVELLVGTSGKAERCYLKDAFRFHPDKGWQRLADLPYPLAAAPSPAPADAAGFRILGGDDGSQLAVPPHQHRGFNKNILRYDAKTNEWRIAGQLPAAPVTTPCVVWNGSCIIPSGEVRPGVRSSQVWSWTPAARE